MWVETVTERGREFMAAWMKQEEDAARSTSRRNPCTDTRRIETCVAPRHVDASRDFYFIFSEREAWGGGGGGCAARLSLLFPFLCSADHERDWPPCKVVFFRVANQCAECENQQQLYSKTMRYRSKNTYWYVDICQVVLFVSHQILNPNPMHLPQFSYYIIVLLIHYLTSPSFTIDYDRLLIIICIFRY